MPSACDAGLPPVSPSEASSPGNTPGPGPATGKFVDICKKTNQQNKLYHKNRIRSGQVSSVSLKSLIKVYLSLAVALLAIARKA